MYTLRHYTPDEDAELIAVYVPSWRRMRRLGGQVRDQTGDPLGDLPTRE